MHLSQHGSYSGLDASDLCFLLHQGSIINCLTTAAPPLGSPLFSTDPVFGVVVGWGGGVQQRLAYLCFFAKVHSMYKGGEVQSFHLMWHPRPQQWGSEVQEHALTVGHS